MKWIKPKIGVKTRVQAYELLEERIPSPALSHDPHRGFLGEQWTRRSRGRTASKAANELTMREANGGNNSKDWSGKLQNNGWFVGCIHGGVSYRG